MKNKILGFFIGLFSLLLVVVATAGTSVYAGPLPSEATISSTEGLVVAQNVEFSNTVTIEGAVDVVGFQFRFFYDQTKFEYVSITKEPALTSNIVVNATIPGQITLNYSDINTVLQGDVGLFSFTFKPIVALGVGYHELLSIDWDYNNEISTLDANYEMGKIDNIIFRFPSVQSGVYGDVSGDGQVTIQDVGLIQLYLAGLRNFNEDQIVLADVNGDGQVTIQDVGLIQLYLAGLRSYLGPAPVQTHKVSFETYGGSIVASQMIANGQFASIPQDPFKAGFTFKGWFSDNVFTTPFDFATPITQPITIHAMWEEDTTNEYTSQDIHDWLIGWLDQMYYEGKEIYSNQLFFPIIKTGDVVRATLTWQTSHPEFLSSTGVYTAPEQDTNVTIWVSFDIDNGVITGEYETSVLVKAQSVTPMQYVHFEMFGAGYIDSWLIEVGAWFDPPTPYLPAYEFYGWFLDADFTEPFTGGYMTSDPITLFAKLEMKDMLYNMYATGHFADWNNAINNPNYLMEEISISDERIIDLQNALANATSIYLFNVTFTNNAPWQNSYLVEGQWRDFNGGLSLKLVKTDEYGNWIYWLPSPESGPVTNLTPDTLWMPAYVTGIDEGYGNWNTNMFAYEPGSYYIIYAMINGEHAVGLVPWDYTPEYLMQWTKDAVAGVIWEGKEIFGSTWLYSGIAVNGVKRVNIEWVSTHPEILDDFGSYTSPEQDTWVTLTYTITVDNQLTETISRNVLVKAVPGLYSIHFETFGGTRFRSINLYEGESFYLNEPSKTDYFFDGWFLDEECTIPLDFNNMPAYNFTVYAKWITINELSIDRIKNLPLGTNVEVEAVITDITRVGYFIYDGTASIFVYHPGNPGFNRNDKVFVQGNTSEYYGATQISNPVTTVIEPAVGEFDYRIATGISIGELRNWDPYNQFLYGQMLLVEGQLVRDYESTNGFFMQWAIINIHTGEALAISNTVSDSTKDLLATYEGKFISAVVLLYTHFFNYNQWAATIVPSTIGEIDEPMPTLEELITRTIQVIETHVIWPGKTIVGDTWFPANVKFNLPDESQFQIDFVWTSSNTDLLGHDGTYPFPNYSEYVVVTIDFMHEGSVIYTHQIEVFVERYEERYGVELIYQSDDIFYYESVAGEKLFFPLHANPGYKITGWYLDPEYNILFEDKYMPNYSITLYAKWEAVEPGTLLYDKTLFEGEGVVVVGVITAMTNYGFTIYDGVEGIYVSLNHYTDNYKVGMVVEVTGIRSSLPVGPSIYAPTLPIVISEVPEEGFDWSFVEMFDIGYIRNLPEWDIQNYGAIYLVEGKLIDGFYNNKGYVYGMAIQDQVTGQTIVLHVDAMPGYILDKLWNYYNQIITIPVVAQRYNYAIEEWLFLVCDDALVGFDYENLTDEEFVDYAIHFVNQFLWNGMEIHNHLYFPWRFDFGPRVAYIEYQTSDNAVLGQWGYYGAPEEDTWISVEVTILLDNDYESTITIDVLVKAVGEEYIEQMRNNYLSWMQSDYTNLIKYIPSEYWTDVQEMYQSYRNEILGAVTINQMQEFYNQYWDEIRQFPLDMVLQSFDEYRTEIWFIHEHFIWNAYYELHHIYFGMMMNVEEAYFSATTLEETESILAALRLAWAEVEYNPTEEELNQLKSWLLEDWENTYENLNWYNNYNGFANDDFLALKDAIINATTFYALSIASVDVQVLFYHTMLALQKQELIYEMAESFLPHIAPDLTEESLVLAEAKLEEIILKVEAAFTQWEAHHYFDEFMSFVQELPRDWLRQDKQYEVNRMTNFYQSLVYTATEDSKVAMEIALTDGIELILNSTSHDELYENVSDVELQIALVYVAVGNAEILYAVQQIITTGGLSALNSIERQETYDFYVALMMNATSVEEVNMLRMQAIFAMINIPADRSGIDLEQIGSMLSSWLFNAYYRWLDQLGDAFEYDFQQIVDVSNMILNAHSYDEMVLPYSNSLLSMRVAATIPSIAKLIDEVNEKYARLQYMVLPEDSEAFEAFYLETIAILSTTQILVRAERTAKLFDILSTLFINENLEMIGYAKHYVNNLTNWLAETTAEGNMLAIEDIVEQRFAEMMLVETEEEFMAIAAELLIDVLLAYDRIHFMDFNNTKNLYLWMLEVRANFAEGLWEIFENNMDMILEATTRDEIDYAYVTVLDLLYDVTPEMTAEEIVELKDMFAEGLQDYFDYLMLEIGELVFINEANMEEYVTALYLAETYHDIMDIVVETVVLLRLEEEKHYTNTYVLNLLEELDDTIDHPKFQLLLDYLPTILDMMVYEDEGQRIVDLVMEIQWILQMGINEIV